jgi:hypothetical protein
MKFAGPSDDVDAGRYYLSVGAKPSSTSSIEAALPFVG